MNGRGRLPRAFRLLLVATGLVLLLSARALAQGGRLELTGFLGGVSVTQDLGLVSNVFFDTTGQAVDTQFGRHFGFRAGFNANTWLGVEGYLSRSKRSFAFTAVDDVELGTVSVGDQLDATQLSYGGDVVFQAPFANGLAPYGTVGFGWQRSEPDDPVFGVDRVTSTDFNFGAGVKYFLVGPGVPWLGVRFEIRYHILSDGLAFYQKSVEPRNTEITIGASFRL